MYSSPRPQCDRIAHRLLWVPVGTKSAASKPSRPAIFSCSALMLGSSAKTSSPSGAAIMAARIAAVGWVTVSLRRSTTFDAEALMALVQVGGKDGEVLLGEDG